MWVTIFTNVTTKLHTQPLSPPAVVEFEHGSLSMLIFVFLVVFFIVRYHT